MISLRTPVHLFLALLASVGVQSALADARQNPYSPIVDRNVFGLRPPPPPVVETNQTPPVPAAKVVLTGITSMFGPQSTRAFFEITETEPGKPATTPKRPILGVGDREGDIEVVSIDIEQNIVRIRNRSIESELTFEVPKSATAGAANMAANPPAVNPQTAAVPGSGQPTIISSSESRGGVTMFGGGGNSPGNSGGSVSTFGGAMPLASASASPSSYNPSAYSGGGPPIIPSRTMRTPAPETQNVDPETRLIRMETSRMYYDAINQREAQNPKPGRRPIEYPPLPPTSLTPQLQDQTIPGAGGMQGPPPIPRR